MIILFIILVGLAVPSWTMFNEFEGRDRSKMGLMHKLTLGQLGFAKALCKDTSLESGLLNLVCYTG